MRKAEPRAIIMSAVLRRHPRAADVRRQLIDTLQATSDGGLILSLLPPLSRGLTKAETALLSSGWGTFLAQVMGEDREALLEAFAHLAPIIASVCGRDGTRDVVEGMFDVGRWCP